MKPRLAYICCDRLIPYIANAGALVDIVLSGNGLDLRKVNEASFFYIHSTEGASKENESDVDLPDLQQQMSPVVSSAAVSALPNACFAPCGVTGVPSARKSERFVRMLCLLSSDTGSTPGSRDAK